MGKFVKLDIGFLDSTAWTDPVATRVFLASLLMASPRVIDTESPQLHVRAGRPTGWCAPPGRYGFVSAAGIGIIGRARVDQKVGMDALERMGEPEPESRSQDYDGRRLIRVDGGYLVLTFARHHDRDATAAERMARWRAKKAEEARQKSRRKRKAEGEAAALAVQTDLARAEVADDASLMEHQPVADTSA